MGYTLGPPKPKILILRHRHQNPAFYDQFLHWLLEEFPELSSLFHIHDLPDPIPDYPNYVLLVPWMQDPVEDWSPSVFAQVCQLTEILAGRGIPTINPLDRQSQTTKCRGSEIMRAAGFRTPEMRLIEDPAAFLARPTLDFPMILREDRGHRGPMIRVWTQDELAQVDFGEFRHPVAAEFVDVQDSRDGLYRKYRYFVAGRYGVSHHLVISDQWVTHGEKRVISDSTRDEELQYLRQEDPQRDRFMAATEAFGLDKLAFDYGFTHEGETIVWEANPYPSVQFGVSDTIYRNPARHRTFRAMLAMYLDKAGIPLPEGFGESLAYPMPAEEELRNATIPHFLS